jgi:heme-degrading monooxygenase HmoA
MHDGFYTLASWHIQEGQEEEFLRIWKDELAHAFLNTNPKAQGTLIQSLEDPCQFYSFGPWESLGEMEAARSDVQVRAAIGKLLAVCDQATPGAYRVVLTIP